MRRIALALLFAAGVLSASAKDWKVEPETALEEVNTWGVKPGDRVLFRRGGVWRGTLRVKSGASGSPVTYSCFGEGEKPQLSQSVAASDPRLWKSANHDRRFGLWKTVAELAPLLDAEVGCLMADIGKVQDGMTQENIWRKVDAETNVVDQMTFYYDPKERSVVAKRWKDPATWMGNVELLLAKDIVDARGCHDVLLDGLCLRYTSSAAVRCSDASGVAIRNCDISYVGEGIVFGGDVRECAVSRCRVWQTLGAAVAADGEENGVAGDGVSVRDCVMWKCEHTLRIGAAKGQATAIPVLFEHNTSVDCGIGNLARYQAQPRGRTAHLLVLGVIDVSHYPHTWGSDGRQYSLVHLTHCRDVMVEGVTIRGSYHWTIYPEASDGVTIRNVKICGDRCNNDDGIDPSNVRDLLIDDCFIRTQDDCIAVKGVNFGNGPCERITVTNCVLWADFARIACLGHESNAPHMCDITMADCDILHFSRPILIVQPSDSMAISNVVCRDMRVHVDGRAGATHLMDFQPVTTVYSKTKNVGGVSGISAEGIALEGLEKPFTFSVKGRPESVTSNVVFRGVTFNGKPLPKSCFTTQPHTANVVVESGN